MPTPRIKPRPYPELMFPLVLGSELRRIAQAHNAAPIEPFDLGLAAELLEVAQAPDLVGAYLTLALEYTADSDHTRARSALELTRAILALAYDETVAPAGRATGLFGPVELGGTL